MKKIIDCENSELVLTKNEVGYHKVLEDFKKTKEIFIVSYNVSTRNDNSELINILKKLEGVRIKFVTNIPNRTFNKSDSQIQEYLNILDPKKFASDTSVYFNFSNHSKIIATDNYVYIGSGNFTNASSQKFEAGIVSSDLTIIEKVKSEFIETIIESSIEYFGSNTLQTFILILDKYLSEIELFDDLFLSNIFNRYLSAKEGERVLNIKKEKLQIVDFEDFKLNTSFFIEELNDLKDSLIKHIDTETKELLIELENYIISDESINKFVKFNKDKFLFDHYESLSFFDTGENSDELLQKSLEEAEFENDEIIENIKPNLIDLDEYIDSLKYMIEHLKNKFINLRKKEAII
jgi:hypothetical protein